MEDYPMLEDIIINRANELIPILNKMGKRGSLLMVLFALERQWQLFLKEIKGKTEYEDLCNSAKECKDILWEHFFNLNKHHLSRNINRYLELTEKFESLEFGILILDELYLSYLACVSNPLCDSNDSCNDLFGYALSLFFVSGFFVLFH